MVSKRTKNIALSILIATGIAGLPVIGYYLGRYYPLIAFSVLGLAFVWLVYSVFRFLESRLDKPDTR